MCMPPVGAITAWALENYKIPYLIGTVGVDNIKSQKVLNAAAINR